METTGDLAIREALPGDAAGIARIYNHYVSQTVITFEEDPVSTTEMSSRISEAGSATLPWLVAERGDSLLGYAYARKWGVRSAYRLTTEVTLYVAPDFGRIGIGSRLYEDLLPRLQARGIHTAIGGIALPNEASVALHEKFGFSKAAHFREVGFKFNRWVDVGYWQRTL